jgi:alpha-glucosidase (family GH31 glycosyl hydrolase)
MSSGPCAYTNFPLPSKECANVDLWAILPHRFGSIIRETTILRSRLLPYIYSSAQKSFITGVPWIRHLYYDFPDIDDSYFQYSQYMFGDDMIVAPIVGQPDPDAPTCTKWRIWVPPGLWYSEPDSALIEGPTFVERYFDLSEIPRLIRAGSVIPQRRIDETRGSTKLVGIAMMQYTDLVFEIIPGANHGSIEVYEDDGDSVNYVDNADVGVGCIKMSYKRLLSKFSTTIHIIVEAIGNYSQSIKALKLANL